MGTMIAELTSRADAGWDLGVGCPTPDLLALAIGTEGKAIARPISIGETGFGHDAAIQKRVLGIDAAVDNHHRRACALIAGGPNRRHPDHSGAAGQRGDAQLVFVDAEDLGCVL